MGRTVRPPAPVIAALEETFGRSIAHVRVIEHSWFARLHLRAIATTRRDRIYLRGDAASFFANESLMLHEYFHVLEQWQPGRLTISRYLREWLKRGYWRNRYEVEARRFARDYCDKYRSCAQRYAADTSRAANE